MVDDGVGKTCMLGAFAGEPYPKDYEPMPLEARTFFRPYAGKQYCLYLSDTGLCVPSDRPAKGLIERPFPFIGFARSHCIPMCFALDNRDSLKHLTDWYAEVRQYQFKALIVLVGTKSDQWNRGGPGAISQADIDAIARAVQAHKVVYCSAKTNEGIDAVFDLPVAAIRKRFQVDKRPSVFPTDKCRSGLV
jgi:GTPase SAR1 family protein